MLQTESEETKDGFNASSLMDYFLQQLEKVLTANAGRRSLDAQGRVSRPEHLRALDKEKLLTIEKIEAGDMRCDARYPQGCWHILTNEGLRLMADAQDKNGVHFLLDLAVECLVFRGGDINMVFVDAGLWGNSSGNNYRGLDNRRRWRGAPASALCMHAINGNDGRYKRMEVEFDSVLNKSTPVKVSLFLEFDQSLKYNLQSMQISSRQKEAAGAANKQQVWHLTFALHETDTGANRRPSPLLRYRIESPDGRMLQASDLPVSFCLQKNDVRLLTTAISINDHLEALYDLRKKITRNPALEKDDKFRRELALFSPGEFANLAFRNQQIKNGTSLMKEPAWNGDELIELLLDNKEILNLLRKKKTILDWATALRAVCSMRPSAKKDYFVDTVARCIMDAPEQGEYEHIGCIECLLNIHAWTDNPERAENILYALSNRSSIMDDLFNRLLGDTLYKNTPYWLKDENAARNLCEEADEDEWTPGQSLLSFMDLEPTEAAANFIRRRLLDKLPNESFHYLENLMQQRWGGDQVAFGMSLMAKRFAGFNAVLTQYIIDRHAKNVLQDWAKSMSGNNLDATGSPPASVIEPAGTDVVQQPRKKTRSIKHI